MPKSSRARREPLLLQLVAMRAACSVLLTRALSVISRMRRWRGKFAWPCGGADVFGEAEVGELGERDVDREGEMVGDIFGGGEDGSEKVAGE